MSIELLGQVQGWLFAACVVFLVALEWLSPLRRRPDHIFPRWLTNIGLYLLSGFCLFLILPAGLLNVITNRPPHGLAAADFPVWFTIPVTALIIDAWRYWLHRWYHEIPLLWRAHLVHHSDPNIDVTTTERHHPLEAVVSLAGLLALASLLGLPAEGIAVYVLVAMVVALVSHANIELSPALDSALRKVIVTPAVHAIHHSDQQAETDSNYGALLTVWDRLFGTYTQPASDRDIRFGLAYFRESTDETFWRTLLQPFNYDSLQATSRSVLLPPGTIGIFGLLAVSIAGIALVTLALWPIASGMIGVWAEREQWQYAFMVLPVFVYLVGWEFRGELMQAAVQPGLSGLWLALPACLVVLLGEILDINLGRQIGLALCYQAIVLAAVGGSVYFRYLPLWFLLLLMVPYEDIAMPPLRAATLWSVEAVYSLTDLNFSANGYAFAVNGNRYEVLPACAGVNFFTLAVFLGYSFGLVAFRRLLPVLGFAAICGTAAVLANAFRVNAIVAGDLWRGTQADLAGHSPYQWVAFALMVALIVLLVSQLRITRPAIPATAKSEKHDLTRWWAPFAIASLCSLVTLTQPAFTTTASRDINEFSPFTAPGQLGRLKPESPTTAWQQRPGRGIAYNSTRYASDSGEWRVLVEIPLSYAVKLDSAQIEPDGIRAWQHRSFDIRNGCHGSHCISYVHHAWRLKGTEEVYNVYASYVVNDGLTASKLAVRLRRGLDKMLGLPDQTAMVAIASDAPIEDSAMVVQQLLRVAAGIHSPTARQTD